MTRPASLSMDRLEIIIIDYINRTTGNFSFRSYASRAENRNELIPSVVFFFFKVSANARLEINGTAIGSIPVPTTGNNTRRNVRLFIIEHVRTPVYP